MEKLLSGACTMEGAYELCERGRGGERESITAWLSIYINRKSPCPII
jgi:hypothetical protein